MRASIPRRLALLLIAGLWSAGAHAGVGKVLFVIGGASAERGVTSIAIQRGFEVEPGDILVTGLSGRMHVRMDDGALISLKPDTRFAIETYDVPATTPDGEDAAAADTPSANTASTGGAADLINRSDESGGTGRAVMSLIKGGFRTITGLIGKSDRSDYQVKTPVATIGIRGTDWSAYQCTGDCANPDALYFAVWEGAISVESEGGSDEFPAGQSGVVINASAPPQQTANPDPKTVTRTPASVADDDGDGEGGDDDAGGDDAPASSGDQADDAGDTSGDLPTADSRPIEPQSTDDPEELGERDDGADGGDGGDGGNGGGGEPQPVSPVATGTGPFRGTSGFVTSGNTNLADTTDDGALVRTRNGHPDGSGVYSLGTAQTVNTGFDPETNIRWGRWTGGTANFTPDDGSAASQLDLTNQSLHYVLGPQGANAPVMPITGTAEYTLVGNTNPTDGSGNVGVLGSASLSANFTEQTVDSTVGLSINDQVWNASGSGDLLGGSNVFAGQYDTVSVDGSTDGNSGIFSGFFTGTGADDVPDGAGLIYNLTNGSDAVTGAAVFGEPSP